MLMLLIEDELLLLRHDLKILICSVKNAKASQKCIYRTFYVSKKHERLQKIESFKNIMISKGFYFSSKIEKDKGDREFKQLGLKSVHKIYVSPNRPNLKISVVKCKKEMRFKQLAGLVSLLKEKGMYIPKTLIFCTGTLTDIAVVLNHLLLELGKSAYSPCDDQSSAVLSESTTL